VSAFQIRSSLQGREEASGLSGSSAGFLVGPVRAGWSGRCWGWWSAGCV